MSFPRHLTRRLTGAPAPCPFLRRRTPALNHIRTLTTTPTAPATALPITAHGPPPEAPLPSRSQLSQFRATQKAATSKSKRFWKEVHVIETEGGYTINLDTRPLRTPQRLPLLIPRSKPLLADAIALEWSHLRSAADATKTHRIPLTQLSSRALDMAASEASDDFTTRASAVANLIRYLDTDTVLCWAPTTPEHLRDPERPQLRDQQVAVARELMAYLDTRVWPGLVIHPVDGDVGMVGKPQPEATRKALVDWMNRLDTWKLVGLERIVHATKSFVIGARMVAEWGAAGDAKWGVEEAAKAASIEVAFQTHQWGEVEDTHDVEKEDVGRQIGGGWLLIVGEV